MSAETVTIPARGGKAARVRKGQHVKIINTHGEQVVDTWAFNAEDLNEFMSMEHTRATILKLIPQVGDSLVTNMRRPILTMTEDTTPWTSTAWTRAWRRCASAAARRPRSPWSGCISCARLSLQK